MPENAPENPPAPPVDPMAEVLRRLEDLENQNKALAAINTTLKDTLNDMLAAPGVGHLMTQDPLVKASRRDVARHVVIATRPVRENPEQYTNVVDPGTVAPTGGFKE